MKVDSKIIVAGIAIVVVLAIIAVIGAACCACVFCAWTGNWNWGNWGGYAQTEHRVDKTVQAGADNIELEVDTIAGNVEIQESAVSDVTVTYDIFGPAGRLNDIRTGTSGVNVNNDTVRIRAEARLNPGILLIGKYGAHVTVMVPKNSSYSLTLHTLGGDIKVPPLQGTSVYMDTLGGKLSLNGGRYETVYLNTAGGDIFASYEATNATFKTLGGKIEVDTTQTTGTLNANTKGGNIAVTLPSETLFTIDASTLGGHVRHGSIRMTPTSENDWTFAGQTEGGAGSLKITLKTMGGDIDIGY